MENTFRNGFYVNDKSNLFNLVSSNYEFASVIWKKLWDDFNEKFVKILNCLPKTGLILCISPETGVDYIRTKLNDEIEFNGKFFYNWIFTATDYKLLEYHVSNKVIFQDILSCYNSFVHFYNNEAHEKQKGKLEIIISPSIEYESNLKQIIDISKLYFDQENKDFHLLTKLINECQN